MVCCALFACTPEDSGKPGTLYGTVTDKSTGDPVATARVELMPKGLKTVTGSDGTYQFSNVEPGQYNLFVTKVGYQDLKSNDITIPAGESVPGDVQIEKIPASLRIVDNSNKQISEIDFGSNEGVTSKTFNIFNGGTETLNYTITKTADWIETISQTIGMVNVGVTFPVILTINRELLADGLNSTSILITSPSAGGVELIIKATKGAPVAETCTVVFELFDSFGDGWNGAVLGVTAGSETHSLTIEEGNIKSYSFDFKTGSSVSVTYSGGEYSDENSFRIIYENGDLIHQGAQGSFEAGLQCSFIVDCSGGH